MVSWQAFPSLPPSSHTPRVSLEPKDPLSLPFQTPATQASRRPKMCRPAADEAPLRTREKTCGTQGSLHALGNKSVKLVKKIMNIWRSYMRTAEWRIMWNNTDHRKLKTQLLQLWKESLEKIGFYGNWTLDRSAIPVQRSYLYWANKPTGSRSLNWFVVSPWKDDDGVINIWKSSNFLMSGFLFATAKVTSVTAMIFFHIKLVKLTRVIG